MIAGVIEATSLKNSVEVSFRLVITDIYVLMLPDCFIVVNTAIFLGNPFVHSREY